MSRRNRRIHAARSSAAAEAGEGPSKKIAVAIETLTLEKLEIERPDKRLLVYNAVADQLDHDNKRPFNLAQKLGDAPYRYNRDTLWAALISISSRLAAGTPRLIFATEDDFPGPGDFASFVITGLNGTVSALISAITGASRWPK